MPETKPEETKFVNVLMPRTLEEKLTAMADVDDTDRSKFVRRLISREWNRRQKAKSKSVGQYQNTSPVTK